MTTPLPSLAAWIDGVALIGLSTATLLLAGAVVAVIR